ncbi:MAG: hypothetical protein U0175_13160 [Caldilineaceae bacterium]
MMNSIQQFIRNHFIACLLSLVAAGFLVVLGDLVSEHHLNGVQLIGFFATILGFLMTVHGILAPTASRKLAVAFLVLALFGLLGAYEHHESATIKGEIVQLEHQLSGDTSAINPVSGPPPLAPLSLSGLATFAMFLLLATETTENEELSHPERLRVSAPMRG